MLAQRLQAKPEPHEDPLLCGRLLQQEAAIFSQSPSTPPGCDVGYGEREFQRQLSASRLLLCFFWSCVSKFNGTLYSHCPCHTSQPCSIEKYFDKMAASYMARIPQSRSSSCGSNSAYSRCTSMILYQIIFFFYCWLTQQHFNFSVSFSFKAKNSACKQGGMLHVWIVLNTLEYSRIFLLEKKKSQAVLISEQL